MKVEQKLEALYSAVNKVWDDAYDGWEWEEDEKNPQKFVLGEKTNEYGFTFFLSGCEDAYGGWIWIEYEPENDLVGIYIKDRPIQSKFTEDLKALFDKYSPFGMRVSYESKTTPIISRIEKVEIKDLTNFFREFKREYKENYPLFYMFTVSAREWYDGFSVVGSDC